MSDFLLLLNNDEPQFKNVILNYKTNKCQLKKCLEPQCASYHDCKDQRRNVFTEKAKNFIYSNEQIIGNNDILKKLKGFALNEYEKNFHFLSYKTQICDKKSCEQYLLYCPFIHDGEINRTIFLQKYYYNSQLNTSEKDRFDKLFDLNTFKTELCKNNYSHSINTCIYFHSKKDQRRSLLKVYYRSEDCQYQENCPYYDKCQLAHNKVELFYHPDKFKKKFCGQFPSCKFEEFCSFAHSQKELKIERLIHQLQHDVFFFTQIFKTISCPFSFDHDKAFCDYYHNPQDYRRKFTDYQYEAIECQEWLKIDISNYNDGGCSNKKNCRKCHGWKEFEYHPDFYKTKKCMDDKNCKKKNCSFYHNELEKRVVTNKEKVKIINFQTPQKLKLKSKKDKEQEIIKQFDENFSFNLNKAFQSNSKNLLPPLNISASRFIDNLSPLKSDDEFDTQEHSSLNSKKDNMSRKISDDYKPENVEFFYLKEKYSQDFYKKFEKKKFLKILKNLNEKGYQENQIINQTLNNDLKFIKEKNQERLKLIVKEVLNERQEFEFLQNEIWNEKKKDSFEEIKSSDVIFKSIQVICKYQNFIFSNWITYILEHSRIFLLNQLMPRGTLSIQLKRQKRYINSNMKSTSLKSILLIFLIFSQNGFVVLASTASEEKSKKSSEGFDESQIKDIEENSEKHEFQAEVGRLMDIIINSLYTQKEIFLREVISNASDALDKIRFMSIANPEVLKDFPELSIRISYDNDAKTLSIQDSGVGMTKQDLINNLGTIAKSGTTNFIEAIKGGNINLIGQFGVGFYSTFLAGHKVQVISKHNDDDQYIWESAAANSFSLVKDPRGNTLKRGSKVVVHLKQDAYEFAEESRIRALVKKYSEFINFPIYLRIAKEVSKEVPVEDEEDKEKSDDKKDDVEVTEKDDSKPKTKTIKEKAWEWELINDNKALWLRNKEEIEEEEYNKFYKSLSKETENPLAYIHFTAEGEVEFKSILYVPGKAPQEMYDNYYGKSSSLKLYVRRVLINEEFEDLMPRYLAFIKGVVDSDELPLNVSRESLQQLKMMKVISRKLVRKAIEMIKKIAEPKDEEDDEEEEASEKKETKEPTEDKKQKKEEAEQKYLKFFQEFGKNIKLGIIEDPGNRSKLAKLTRWFTTKSLDQRISLDKYIENAVAGQDYIYYIAGEGKDQIMKSPVLQALILKGYEVLVLEDPIDEFVFQHLTEYEKKKLVNVQKGDFKFPDEDDTLRRKHKKLKRLYQPLTNWWKKIFSEELESVTVSQRLIEDPCVAVSEEHGQSANLERIQKAQTYANPSKQQQKTKKILEINPNHPIMKELLERVKDGADSEIEDYAKVLTETAFINSGYVLQNPQEYAHKFYKLFRGAIGVPKDAEVEEINVNLDEDDEEEDKKANQGSQEKVNKDEDENSKAKDEL